jgi:hypothetical protein
MIPGAQLWTILQKTTESAFENKKKREVNSGVMLM